MTGRCLEPGPLKDLFDALDLTREEYDGALREWLEEIEESGDKANTYWRRAAIHEYLGLERPSLDFPEGLFFAIGRKRSAMTPAELGPPRPVVYLPGQVYAIRLHWRELLYCSPTTHVVVLVYGPWVAGEHTLFVPISQDILEEVGDDLEMGLPLFGTATNDATSGVWGIAFMAKDREGAGEALEVAVARVAASLDKTDYWKEKRFIDGRVREYVATSLDKTAYWKVVPKGEERRKKVVHVLNELAGRISPSIRWVGCPRPCNLLVSLAFTPSRLEFGGFAANHYLIPEFESIDKLPTITEE